MIFLAAIFAYAFLVVALNWFLRWLRPAWSPSRIAITANAPGPLVIVTALIWFVVTLGPAPPGEIDATGMALMVYMVGGAAVIAAMIVVGTVAGVLMWRLRR